MPKFYVGENVTVKLTGITTKVTVREIYPSSPENLYLLITDDGVAFYAVESEILPVEA